ncbi:MAG: pilus assembly protein CpaE [Sphingomonadales bacterium]
MNAPSISIKPAGEPIEYTCKAYVCDDATRELLASVLEDANWVNSSVDEGGIQEAIRRLAVESSPQFLIVDLTDCEDPRTEISALAEVCEPGICVLALGTVNDVGLYRDLLGSGIQDYLVKPANASMLGEALAFAEATLSQDGADDELDEAEKRFCTFIGTRGGVGATTLATSVSYYLSTNHKRNTAFLDLDIHFGAGALTFDLEPGRGLCDAIENPGRVDSLFIDRATIKQNEKLSILGAEAPINDPAPADPTALTHLQSELFGGFDCVIVDMPKTMLSSHGHLTAQATDIVLVSDLSLTSARDTIRMLQYFSEQAPKAKVHLILNKVATTVCEMTKADFEQSVERKVDLVLPYDPKPAVDAAKKGESVTQAAATCKLSGGIKKLSNMLCDKPESAEKESILAKLGLPASLKLKKSDAA